MIASQMNASDAASTYTHVELIWRAKQIEQRIRFGHPAATVRIDRERRRVRFSAGSIFAVLRWTGNSYGTTTSRIDILRAVSSGEPFTSVPQVDPGAEILLSISTWPKVESVLQAIEAVEALDIDPVDAAPDHWRHIHNRISVGDTPRRYTRGRHQAWLKRRRIAP